MTYPAGTRVERKNTAADKSDTHGVPSGAKGTVSGRTAFNPADKTDCIGVTWDEEWNGQHHWFSRAENLIPLEES